jgi:hypothetical protein
MSILLTFKNRLSSAFLVEKELAFQTTMRKLWVIWRWKNSQQLNRLLVEKQSTTELITVTSLMMGSSVSCSLIASRCICAHSFRRSNIVIMDLLDSNTELMGW